MSQLLLVMQQKTFDNIVPKKKSLITRNLFNNNTLNFIYKKIIKVWAKIISKSSTTICLLYIMYVANGLIDWLIRI